MIDSDAAFDDLLGKAKAALVKDGCTCSVLVAVVQGRHRSDCPLADQVERN